MVSDRWYAALFDKKDLPRIYRLAEKIRATHDNKLIDEFNESCVRKFNDHNPMINGVEPLQATKSGDMVVNSGLKQCLDIIIHVSTARFQYMGSGTGIGNPFTTQTALETEILPRVDVSLFGWRENASTSLQFAGIFGDSRPTNTISEAGIFNLSSAGIMLNRTMFSQLPIAHTVNVTGYVISSVVDFVPVMP